VPTVASPTLTTASVRAAFMANAAAKSGEGGSVGDVGSVGSVGGLGRQAVETVAAEDWIELGVTKAMTSMTTARRRGRIRLDSARQDSVAAILDGTGVAQRAVEGRKGTLETRRQLQRSHTGPDRVCRATAWGGHCRHGNKSGKFHVGGCCRATQRGGGRGGRGGQGFGMMRSEAAGARRAGVLCGADDRPPVYGVKRMGDSGDAGTDD
jgi:hypothetical protein